MKYKHVQITLKPEVCEGVVKYLTTTIEMEDAAYKKGDIFDSLAMSIAGCETGRYGEKDIEAFDDAGNLPVEITQTIGMYGPQKNYIFGRDVEGKLTISYRGKSHVRELRQSGPGFSLYQNAGGCTAAGLIFMLLPNGETFDFEIKYDLSQMEKGAKGYCGYGEGNMHKVCKAEDVKYTFYCMGSPKEYHQEESKMHILWFYDDFEHIDEFCQVAGLYFDEMEKRFHDADVPYYMIVFPTLDTDLTGTALPRSCYMGFGDARIKEIKDVESTLAHEYVHNWLSVSGELSLNSMYAEGTAEYYSGLTQYRLGRITEEEYVNYVNKLLEIFYGNPYCETPYQEAYDKSWTHAYAQRMAYSRGYLLMMHLDQMIQSASKGEKCLDDLVVGIVDLGIERNSGVESVSWDEFVQMADELTGGIAAALINQVLEGGKLIPPADYFDDRYVLTEQMISQLDHGFGETVRYENPMTVHDLDPTSNAAKAGLQDGDILLTRPPEWRMGEDEHAVATYLVQRGKEKLEIAYVPRGKKVPCWQYVKK